MIYVIRCFYEERQSTFSWSEAEIRCQASGSHLVSINSEEQLQEVKDALGGVIAESYWIGLNDQDTEGTYVWSDGTQLGRVETKIFKGFREALFKEFIMGREHVSIVH